MSEIKDSLEFRLIVSLDEANKKPDLTKRDKSLTTILYENLDAIEQSKNKGVSYKQIAEGMGATESYFNTCLLRARKKRIANKQNKLDNPVVKNIKTAVENKGRVNREDVARDPLPPMKKPLTEKQKNLIRLGMDEQDAREIE